MRYAALPGMLFLFIGTAANAQLSVQPQIGLEQSKASFNFNNSSFVSLGNVVVPRGDVRVDYKFKKGHGPFASIGTSPATQVVSFTGFEEVNKQFASATGSLQWRLEGGYQYTSKPINFKKASTVKTVVSHTPATVQKRCGSYTYKTACGANKQASTPKNTNWNMRLQPSAGAAFIPNASNNVVTKEGINGTSYEYRAGNWNTAFVSGLGFLFGKGSKEMFSLNLYYLKGLGNLGNETLTKQTEGKTTTAQIRSSASSWSLSFGLPLHLQKQPKAKAIEPRPVEKTESYKPRCGQYSRCTKRS